MSEEEKKSKNIIETLIRGITINFNPDDSSITVRIPSVAPGTGDNKRTKTTTVKIPSVVPTAGDRDPTPPDNLPSRFIEPKSPPVNVKESKRGREEPLETDLELVDLDYDLDDDLNMDLEDTEPEPVRVKIHLKAYIKMALHAMKYANRNISPERWVEVIGLMTGYIENKDTPLACIVVTDAYPIGHGTNINAQIQNPQSHVKVYSKKMKGEIITGWYHSHPSFGAFMSKTDYQTQVRYQKLAKTGSQLTAPIALVIDPTKISKRSHGFKIFRLKENLRDWEEPVFEVLDSSLESLPQMMEALLPLTEGRAMFLEYDHES
ncbi:MAG: hypothetical protein ACFFD4_15875 [Candidatus Odinarchaeota archaeon]